MSLGSRFFGVLVIITDEKCQTTWSGILHHMASCKWQQRRVTALMMRNENQFGHLSLYRVVFVYAFLDWMKFLVQNPRIILMALTFSIRMNKSTEYWVLIHRQVVKCKCAS